MRARFLLGSAVAFALLAFWDEGRPAFRPWGVLGLWLVSIGLLLAAARTMDALRREPWARRFSRGEAAIVLLLFLGALLVRVIALDRVPGNFSGDEGEMGEWARGVVSGEHRDPFTTGWLGHPTLWFFLQAGSLRVFGDTVFGLRMLSALIGAATVPALYLFARRPYGRAVALAAALLLAMYHFHVHFSRIGLNNIADSLLALLAFTAFLRAYETGSRLQFAFAGVVLGVSQLFYYGTRLLPLVVVAVLLHQLVVARAQLRRAAGGLGVMALGFLIGYGPGLRVPLFDWRAYTARLPLEGLFQSGNFDARLRGGESALGILLDQAWRSFGAFTSVVDMGPAQYVSGMPFLDPVSSVLFVAGVLILVVSWRRKESALLLAWLLGTVVFGGILLVNPPQSARFVGTAPATCLLIALSLQRGATALQRVAPRARRFVPISAAAVLLGLVLWNLDFYFRDYSPRNAYGFATTETATAIGRYLERRPPDSYVYFLGPPTLYLGHGTIRFLAPGVRGTDVSLPLGGGLELSPTPPGTRPLFLFLPDRQRELRVVRSRYRQGTLRSIRASSDGRVLFDAYSP